MESYNYLSNGIIIVIITITWCKGSQCILKWNPNNIKMSDNVECVIMRLAFDCRLRVIMYIIQFFLCYIDANYPQFTLCNPICKGEPHP